MTYRLTLILAALVIATPAMAAKQIVVRSTGPSAKAYPVGKPIAAGTKVNLRAGDSITVLGPAKARVFKGPGEFRVIEATEASAFSRSRFSARRGIALPPGPWAANVERSGPVCIAKGKTLSLWRPDEQSETSVTITGKGAKPATLRWPKGEATLAWPSALPLTDGAVYRLRTAGQKAAGDWTIAVIGEVPADRAATAEALLKRGCNAQLDQLVERTLAED